MIAVIVVRDGIPPLGAAETVAEAGGVALVVGSAVASVVDHLGATTARVWEAGAYAPGAWASALAPVLAEYDLVVLPASSDGRDLAPRLAAVLDRPLFAGALRVNQAEVICSRYGGLSTLTIPVTEPCVATLVAGARSGPAADAAPPTVEHLTPQAPAGDLHDAEVLEVLPPDPATMDLTEAHRIFAGGAGMSGPEDFALLTEVATALGGSMGASRVVADAGWVAHDRYIGTTGAVVDPDLYVALGISGAVQHVSGLGTPDHVVAVNTDASCPMMQLADLALVTDAPGFLAALADRLGVRRQQEAARG